VAYIAVALLGMAGGAFCVFMILESQRQKVRAIRLRQAARAQALEDTSRNLRVRREAYEQDLARFKADEAAFAANAVPYHELQEENVILKQALPRNRPYCVALSGGFIAHRSAGGISEGCASCV
jgi:hypothetical protein